MREKHNGSKKWMMWLGCIIMVLVIANFSSLDAKADDLTYGDWTYDISTGKNVHVKQRRMKQPMPL